MLISSFVLNNRFVDPVFFVGGVVAPFYPKEALEALGIGYLMYQGCKYIKPLPRHVFSDGSCYEGYLVNGKKEGQGKLILSNGNCYEGNFVSGKLKGYGKLIFSNGDCYEGNFVSGKRKGYGKFIFSNGDCYEGNFINDKLKGQGKYTNANGDCYEGTFVNDKMEGQGKWTYASEGACYEGGFVNDKMEGQGKWTCPNGDSYKGHWKNDEMISSNIDNLGDDLFFDLLCGSHQMSPPNGYCLGIVLDYLQKNGYEEIAGSLREAQRYSTLKPEEIQKESHIIYRELSYQKKSKLICYGSKEHAMGLNLVSGVLPGFILCEIFNSGKGLNYHNKKISFDLSKIKMKMKYKTMLQVKIPVNNLTPEWIEILLSSIKKTADENEAYEHILNFPGADILPSDSSHWQTEQKGNDCSLQWILKAYCEHKMEDPKGMRKQLKEDCRKARAARMKLAVHVFNDYK